MSAQFIAPPAPRQSGGLCHLRWPALGTNCEVQFVCGDEVRRKAFETEAVGWVSSFEARYSRFKSDSALSRVNASAGREWVAIDAEMEQFLDLCASIFQMTSGVLDVTALPIMRLWDYKSQSPRIPSNEEIALALQLTGWNKVQRRPGFVRFAQSGMALDFGGWGKEYAVDMIAQIAVRHGLTQVLVDFGHDLCAVGAGLGKPAWHIGLEDPDRPGIACWSSLAIKDRAVASSGNYLRGFTLNGRRYGHIVDPRTGWPVSNDNKQVTVIARGCLQAGVLATAAFVLGPEKGIKLIEETIGAEGCIVANQARYQTRGFYNYVVTR